MDRSKLFPQEILDQMPARGETDGKKRENIKVHIKIFNPLGAGTWYLTEYDPEDGIFFGLCVIQEAELGYVALEEMASVKLQLGMTLERDLYMPELFTLADAYKAERKS